MTRIDEKEILEIEKIKQDIQLDMKRFDVELERFSIEQKRLGIEISKKNYDAWKLAFYGVAVGFGGTFALAKTISLVGW